MLLISAALSLLFYLARRFVSHDAEKAR